MPVTRESLHCKCMGQLNPIDVMRAFQTFKSYASLFALLSTAVSVPAATIVEWGAAGGQEMVSANANASSIPSAYTTASYLSPADGASGYSTSIAGQTREYYGASDAQVFGINNNGGDNYKDAIQMVRNFSGAGGTVTSMIAWEASDFMSPVRRLDSFDMEFETRGGTTSGYYLVQTGAGWFRSVESIVDSGSNNWADFAKNVSELTWESFSSFGVSGGSGAVDLSDVQSVGAYFTSTLASGNWAGAKLRYFKVTEVTDVVQTGATYADVSEIAAVVSTTDLINQGQASYAGFTISGNRGGDGAADDDFNDGVAANDFDNMTWFLAGDGDLPATVTVSLDVETHIVGYSIAEIHSFAGWFGGVQADQEVTIEYSVVGDDSFSTLGSFTNNDAGDGEYSRLSLAHYADGYLATGVDVLRFTYADPEGEGLGTDRLVLQEIDVIGVPSVETTNYTYTSISDFQAAVSNGDLVNVDASSLASATVSASYEGLDDGGVNDGVASLEYDSGPVFPNMTWFRNGDGHLPAEVVFNLDVSTNTSGYNISEINSFAGWNGSANQAQQILTVEYSVVGSATWAELGVGTFSNTAAGGGEFSRIQLSASGYLATGVDALRFTYAATGNNLVVQEIDVAGSPILVPPVLELSSMFSDDMILQREKAVPVWGTSTAGASITVEFDGQSKTTTAAGDGNWTVNLDSMSANAVGQDLTVTAELNALTTVVSYSNVLVGEVWVCSGQSNMSLSVAQTEHKAAVEAAPDNSTLRFFKVPQLTQETPQERFDTVWTESTTGSSGTARSFGAVAYFFGLKLQDELESSEGAKDVPVGLIHSAKGGTIVEKWLPAGNDYNSTAGGHYNGQIDAMIPFAMRGVIWYQGESNLMEDGNDGEPLSYVAKKKALIDGWRSLWGENFPFYYVQLAPFDYTASESTAVDDGVLPFFWEAQSAVLDEVSNAGMAVITDSVTDLSGNLDLNELHPRNKQVPGERLALLALDGTYGHDVVSTGPTFQSMARVGSTLELSFGSAVGLTTSDGGAPDSFEIAGLDGVYVTAAASLSGNQVTVSAPEVALPVSIRFAWSETAQPNLRNGAALVPSAFRATDSDGDGILDTVEGVADSDGDGTADNYDLDSDGDGLSDADEGIGDADGDGTPNYLDLDSDNDQYSDALEGGFDLYDPVEVPASYLEVIDTVLAERSQIDESFLDPTYNNELSLGGPGKIRVTFIKEGAANRNSLGYYTYSDATFAGLTKGDVDTDGSSIISVDELASLPDVEIGWVFPNATKIEDTGGMLVQGDSYVLDVDREFPVGTKLGFFLVVKGWLGDGTIQEPYMDGIKPYVMFTTDFLNPEAGGDADLSTDSFANNSRQAALIFDSSERNEIILGFEDIRRRLQADGSIGGDQDFNDAVFSVSSDPSSSLAGSPIAIADPDGVDADGDGILDVDELAGDSDGDGTLNVNDPDDDGDSIVTAAEGTTDSDGDSTANYLDLDSDNDGILDSIEGSGDADADGTANYLDTDSDGDGLSDTTEGAVDSDGDGTSDYLDSDDDGDGIATATEGTGDSDGDGTADYLDTDSDADGISDAIEGAADSDGDGTADYLDADSDADGISDAAEGGADTDGDGTANYLDTDSDGDGISDANELATDTDGDGTLNFLDSDDDGDGLPTVDEGTADPDGDGDPNYLDTDSNNDGEPDGAADAVLVATTKALQSGYTGIPMSPGDQVQYTVTISNTGSDPATNLSIAGLIPTNTDFVSGSLTIDGESSAETLSEGGSLSVSSLAAGASVVLQFDVTVTATPANDAVWIESAVVIDYTESSTSEVSDNDPSGHCGIVDNGVDHASDAGAATDDDDPTRLPLLQATVYESSVLAFEDLKNAGWNDWDMNDLILDITSFYIVNASDEIESVVVTYEVLARGAGMDSQLHLNLPYSGSAEWQRTILGTSGEIEDTATNSGSDAASIQIWVSSKDILPPYTTLKHKWGAARTERFDESGAGKAAIVTVYFADPGSNPLAGFSESPHDTWIYVPSTQQEIHRVEYDLSSTQMVMEGPLFGRSIPFALKFDTDFIWPAENMPIWSSHPEYVNYTISGGTENTDWADGYDVWRVWFDREGMMNGGVYNPVSAHEIYQDYVETWSNPQ